MKYRNYAIMVKENSHYPVSYTIKQDGTKVIENTMLKGGDMTENQIKELFFLGYFEEKPTQEEVGAGITTFELLKRTDLDTGLTQYKKVIIAKCVHNLQFRLTEIFKNK